MSKTQPFDPAYDLLVSAEAMLRHGTEDDERDAWLQAFADLPGANLTVWEVQVLRDKHLRPGHKACVDHLLELGLLETYKTVGREGATEHLRRTKRGSEALRLRQSVPVHRETFRREFEKLLRRD